MNTARRWGRLNGKVFQLRSEAELYQLRADLIRGRKLSENEILELVEELEYYAGASR